jgi:hypothetical protein
MDSPHLVCSVLYVSSPRGKYGVRFLCIIALLNKHTLVKKHGVGMCSSGVDCNRPPPSSKKCFCVFLCIVHCLCVNYTSPIVESMMLLQTITVVSGGLSISWRGFYAAIKLIFIHSTINLYAT